MTKTFKPHSDRVLVKLDGAEKTKGGLFIPGIAQLQREGTVVCVGAGRIFENGQQVRPPFDAGDRVLLDSIGGLDLTLGGEKFVLCRSEEILGFLAE